MQVNRQVIIILILASLLFSSLATAFYFYKKNQKVLKSTNELITVYIAKKDIKRGTLIKIKHLAKTKIAKQFLLNKPLLKKEILGKYINENIYENEVFLKQKLIKKVKKNEKELLEFKYSSYNMNFSIFENPNYSLKQGDTISIISVYPIGKETKGKYSNYKVQYTAKQIRVLGFLRAGHIDNITIIKQKIKKVIKKKVIEEEIDIKAEELILDIKTDVLLSLIKDYNKGNQLWMVKTKEENIIEELIKKSEEKKSKQKKKRYKRVYPFRLYIGNKVFLKKSALINYGEEKESIKKNVTISIDYRRICKNLKDKFIIGKKTRFYIRDQASIKSKNKKTLFKNTIIPYIQKQKDWYLTCDQQYIHTSVVNEIQKESVKKKLGEK